MWCECDVIVPRDACVRVFKLMLCAVAARACHNAAVVRLHVCVKDFAIMSVCTKHVPFALACALVLVAVVCFSFVLSF